MSVFVYVATTQGMVGIQQITAEEPGVQSVVCLDGTVEALPISGRYHQFVKKGTGLIHKDFGHGAFRVDVQGRIDQGNSWQLGIYLAHYCQHLQCLASPPRLLLNEPQQATDNQPTSKDIIIWATGVVKNDKSIAAIDGLGIKWQRSSELLEQWLGLGCQLLCFAPAAERAQSTPVANAPIHYIHHLDEAIGQLNVALQRDHSDRLVTVNVNGPSIGHYQLIKVLGEGGFGTVYLARDPHLDQLVAIKHFQMRDKSAGHAGSEVGDQAANQAAHEAAHEVSNEALFKQRFIDEAKILRQLSRHRHIVDMFEFGFSSQGQPYYTMPYLPRCLKQLLGSDLTDSRLLAELPPLQQPRQLPLPLALSYLRQLLTALVPVHQAGLVHRDIKPANILFDDDETLQLADFGIAKLPVSLGSYTASAVAIGSFHYMSPEQRQSAKHVEASSDVYSCAVVAYRMITGTLPIGRFNDPKDYQPQLTEPLNQLLLACLATDIQQRPADAEAFLYQLNGGLDLNLYGEDVTATVFVDPKVTDPSPASPVTTSSEPFIVTRLSADPLPDGGSDDNAKWRRPTSDPQAGEPSPAAEPAPAESAEPAPVEPAEPAPPESAEQQEPKMVPDHHLERQINRWLKRGLVAVLLVSLGGVALTSGRYLYQQSQIDDLAWQATQQQHTRQGYLDFLVDYQQSEYIEDALAAYRKLDEQAWQQAFKHNTAQSYEDYQLAFPDGLFYRDAMRQSFAIKDRQGWQTAQATATETAYRDYLAQFERGGYRLQAQQQLDLLTDNKDWRMAQNQDNIDAYQWYLQQHDQGADDNAARQFVELAQRRLTELLDIAAQQQQTDRQHQQQQQAQAERLAAEQQQLISDIQRQLVRLDYLQGRIGGEWDSQSVQAMKAFEQDQRLKPLGKASPDRLVVLTQAQIQPLPALIQQFEQIMVAIPAGEFMMGCANGLGNCELDETPARQRQIGGFLMMQHEITWALYWPCVNAGRCADPRKTMGSTTNTNTSDENAANLPVSGVSWQDIQQHYIPWLNQQSRRKYRLPNEAQWEYAARAGRLGHFYWGDKPDCTKALFGAGSHDCQDPQQARAVKQYPANGFGLYDMLGNLWEWVQDCYQSKAYERLSTGPLIVIDDLNCQQRSIRGGSFQDGRWAIRLSNRHHAPADKRARHIGFRLIADNLIRQ